MSWFQRRPKPAEIDEELRFHLEEKVRRLVADGLSPIQARREARKVFGSQAAVQEYTRDTWVFRWADDLWRDLRFAARGLRRTPGFTAVAVLTLALGIGAATAVFSIVYGVMLRPLPFDNPQDVAEVYRRNASWTFGSREGADATQIARWRSGTRRLEQIAEYSLKRHTLTGAAEPASLWGLQVDRAFFGLLRIQARLGRTFFDDDYAGDGRVLVISDRFWRRHLNADPDAVGKTVMLDDASFTVVGVLAPRVRYPFFQDQVAGLVVETWEPMTASRGGNVLVRLAPGANWEQANAELGTMIAEEAEPGTTIYTSAIDGAFESVRRPLWMLLAAASLILLLACLHASTLLLARGVVREKDVALRAALGASRLQLLRQHLVESALLACGAGICGVLFATQLVGWLVPMFPEGIPRTDEIDVDSAALLFCLGVSAATALAAGSLAAWKSNAASVRDQLATSVGSIASPRHTRLLNGLLAGEIALCVVLLVGAGLFLRSTARLLAVNSGFQAQGVLTFRLSLNANRYGEWSRARSLHEELLTKLRTLPGIASADLSMLLPLSGRSTRSPLLIEGQDPDTQGLMADVNVVTPGYFSTVGLSLLGGRPFDRRDAPNAVETIVVSRSTADKLWPGEDPLGKRVRSAMTGQGWRQVVGVVENVKLFNLYEDPPPQVFIPYAQAEPEFLHRMMSILSFISLRTEADPAQFAGAVRAAVHEVEPEQPVNELKPLQQLVLDSIAQDRLRASLLSLLAGIALVVSAIGLYGVTSYLVAQRIREFGLRMALGARGEQLWQAVVIRCMSIVAAGLLVGLGIAAGLARSLELGLYEIQPLDAVTYAAVIAGLGSVAFIACLEPAFRASRMNPSDALRRN